MWADCPYAAFRRYVNGEILPPGIAALQGTATDAAVTLGCDTVIKTGKDAPLDDKKDLAATVFEKKKSDHEIQKDDDIDFLKNQTIKLVELHHKEIAPKIHPISTQEAIAVDQDGYILAGTIDITEEGGCLRDTKTSNRKYSDDAVSTKLQPALYSALYLSKYNSPSNGFAFDVLIKNVRPVAQIVTGVIGQKEINVLGRYIKNTLQELDTSLKSGVFRLAAPEHWRCASSGKWCAYLNTGCPKGKKL